MVNPRPGHRNRKGSPMKLRQWLQTGPRIAIAVMFLYAASAKAFRQDVGQAASAYIFGDWLPSILLRYALICGEAMLAIWLFSGVKVIWAGMMTLAMLSVFSGVIVVELGQKHPKPCGCMGPQATIPTNPNVIKTALRSDLARNALLMMGAGWLYLSASRREHPAET
jgi:uncharacterized membrane protein YphA (DoxX/SURF4 family)